MAAEADPFGRTSWLTARELDELSWRAEKFEELGFDFDRRTQLAQAGADWHEAEAMLQRGATHRDVYAILM